MQNAFAAAILSFAAFSYLWSPWWLIGLFVALIVAVGVDS